MSRRYAFFVLVIHYLILAGIAVARNPPAVVQNPPANDPKAVAYAVQAIAALTGRNSIGDVTLNTTVTTTVGDTSETGTATFEAKGTGESRVDVKFNGSTRSDVRNIATATGVPSGAWKDDKKVAPTAYAAHNCWTDPAWFFPALSSLSQTANPNVVFRYIGQELHAGVNTEHIRTYKLSTLRTLSKMDFYLDPASYLPLAVAFNVHPDNDMNTNVATEIRFDNYQPSGGSQVAFHFQELVNGNVTLDATVTTVSFNTGLTDSLFILQQKQLRGLQ